MGIRGLVNGKDAHDFAIDSIMRNPETWNYNRIQFDIIDELRRCNGRSQRAGMVGSPIRKTYSVGEMGHMRGRDFSPAESSEDVLSLAFLSDRTRFIVEALARGWQQKEISAWLGISEGRVSQIVDRLRPIARSRYPNAVQEREAAEVHVRSAPRDRRSVVQGDAEGKAPPEARAEKEGTLMRRIASQKQHVVHEEVHNGRRKAVRLPKIEPKKKAAKRRSGGK